MQPDSTWDEKLVGSLVGSAKGWHSIQLAVLGFIGFCGVLKMGSTWTGPDWLQWLAGGAVVLSFALALAAVFQVGSVAYPVGNIDLGSATARLRSGIRTTFAAVALLAASGVAAWWPTDAVAVGAPAVQVSDARGASACGQLMDDAPAGSLWLNTDEGRVSVSLSAVAEMRPVGSC